MAEINTKWKNFHRSESKTPLKNSKKGLKNNSEKDKLENVDLIMPGKLQL